MPPVWSSRVSDVTADRWAEAAGRRAEHERQKRLFFDAVLRPHRSLSRPGFIALMAAIGTASTLGAAPFLVAGAWPVLAFMSLNMVLVFAAFHVNYRGARAFETLHLDAKDLIVRKVDADGSSQAWRLEPHWLRIEMDDPASHENLLVLSSGRQRLIVGAFLTPDERLEVAEALGAAIVKRHSVLTTP